MSLPVGTIQLEDVHKSYRIVQKAAPRMGGWLMNKALEYFRREEFEALRGVTLSIPPGEMVGFLGANGAGKSTLLKVIAGIIEPDRGRVDVAGRVTSLLELGVGFHPDLTGMENIFYNGAIMGMRRRQILDRLDAIIAFSGLADFLYEPVRHYSSGMYSRLACSVALHLEPEIILMDEILAVGDAEFQSRCLGRVRELHKRGVTILIVSHDAATLADMCDRMIWVEQGRLREDGPARQVHEHYSHAMLLKANEHGPFAPNGPLAANPPARLAELGWQSGGDAPPRVGDPLRVTAAVRVERATTLRLGLRWTTPEGNLLSEDFSPPLTLAAGTHQQRWHSPAWPLMTGRALGSVVLIEVESGEVLDRRTEAVQPDVLRPEDHHLFLARMGADWQVERLG